MKHLRLICALSAFLIWASSSVAVAQQNTVRLCLGSVTACAPVSATVPLPVVGATTGGGFPAAATPVTGNAAGTTGAVVGTLAGAASKTTYICGFNISAVGGTAAVGPITIAGLVGSSQVYQLNSAAIPVNMGQQFSPCIPASAANTAITITTTANGTATAVNVNSWGYQQ